MPKLIKSLIPKQYDIAGCAFGQWLVLSFVGHNKNGKRVWLCKCKCGVQKIILGSYLRNGYSKRCSKCANSNRRLTAEESLMMVNEYLSGVQPAELRRKFGVNPNTILNHIKRHGYKPRTIKEASKFNRKSPGEAAFSQTYKRYKANATWRRLEFALTKTQFRSLTQQTCYYCGSKPSNITTLSSGVFIYNGLDRVNNNCGYIYDNVVSCCKICNIAKRSLSLNEFLTWIDRLINHNIGKLNLSTDYKSSPKIKE